MKIASNINNIIALASSANELQRTTLLSSDDLASIFGGSGSGGVQSSLASLNPGAPSEQPSGYGPVYDQTYAAYPRPETAAAEAHLREVERQMYESSNNAIEGVLNREFRERPARHARHLRGLRQPAASRAGLR